MYYYYTLATYHRSVWWKKYITIGQMVQFWIDMIYTWIPTYYYFSGSRCTFQTWTLVFGHGIGLSFFLLFFELFRETYYSTLKGKIRRKVEKTE